MNHKKICVVGLGGVGGYIGAMLAHSLEQVYFYVRGERLKHIRASGLTLSSKLHGDFTVSPKLASDDPILIGKMDLVILAVKHFSLEKVCEEIQPMIGPDTVVIPLLNGVDTGGKVRNLLKIGIVLDALIYIISETTADYRVLHQSPYGNIHLGMKEGSERYTSMLTEIQLLLEGAGITCKVEEDIEAAVWRKYILNCAYNVITAYYQGNTADLRSNQQAVKEFSTLLDEGCQVARKRGVRISPELEEQLLQHVLTKQDPTSTSSLNRDFLAKRENELEIFSGDLLNMATELGIDLPMTQHFYQALKER